MHPSWRTSSRRFSSQKGNPHTRHAVLCFCPSSIPQQPLVCFLSAQICLFQTFHVSAIIHCVTFCVWLLSLSVMSVQFILLQQDFISFLAEQHAIVWISRVLLVSWSVNGSLDCLYLIPFVVMSKATVNICMPKIVWGGLCFDHPVSVAQEQTRKGSAIHSYG